MSCDDGLMKFQRTKVVNCVFVYLLPQSCFPCWLQQVSCWEKISMYVLFKQNTSRSSLLAINIGSLLRHTLKQYSTRKKKKTPKEKTRQSTDVSRISPSLESNVSTVFFPFLAEYFFKLFLCWFSASRAPRGIKPPQRAIPRGALPRMRNCVKNCDRSYCCLR